MTEDSQQHGNIKCLYPQKGPISTVQMNPAIDWWLPLLSYCGEGYWCRQDSCKEPYTNVETQGILQHELTEDLLSVKEHGIVGTHLIICNDKVNEML